MPVMDDFTATRAHPRSELAAARSPPCPSARARHVMSDIAEHCIAAVMDAHLRQADSEPSQWPTVSAAISTDIAPKKRRKKKKKKKEKKKKKKKGEGEKKKKKKKGK